MAVKPRLLFVCPIAPSETGNGLAMRGGIFLEALGEICDVTVRVVPVADTTGRHKLSEFTRRWAHDCASVPLSQSADEDANGTMPRLAALGLAPDTVQALADNLAGRQFDALFVQRLYMAPLALAGLDHAGIEIPQMCVLDGDDDEVESARRMASLYASQGRADLALACAREAGRHENLAAEMIPHFGLVCVCSSRDAAKMHDRQAAGSTIVVPNSVPMPASDVPRPPGGPKRILFLGGLSYEPNTDAAELLANEIFPRLLDIAPMPLNLVLAGADPPERVRRLGDRDNVQVTGFVEDLDALYAASDIVAVPLRAGAGTRIKILEAFAHRRPVVSSTIGAEGIEVQAGRDLLIADEPPAFAACCARLLENEGKANSVARAGHLLFLNAYERSIVKTKIQSVVDAEWRRGDRVPATD